MAHKIGTATNFSDYVTQLLEFLSTDPTLVANGQQWQILRNRRNNLQGVAVYNCTQADSNSSSRQVKDVFRIDPRTSNGDSYTTEANFNCALNSFVQGTSHFVITLVEARELDKVQMSSGIYNSVLSMASQLCTNFTLQYSDDGATWTNALVYTAGTTWTAGEVRQYQIPAGLGAHKYWKFIPGAGTSGTTVRFHQLLLLEADGTVANHFGDEVILKGTGSSGSEQIFVGFRTEFDITSGWYNFILNGFRGYDADTPFFDQIGGLPSASWPSDLPANMRLSCPVVPMWDQPMKYWFTANGRRFIFSAKVSSSNVGAYLGFGLPYATPTQYPYPLVVSGTLLMPTSGRNTNMSFTLSNGRNTCPNCPGGTSTAGASLYDNTTAYVMLPDSSWRPINSRHTTGSSSDGIVTLGIPTNGGGYALPISIINFDFNKPYKQVLGGGYLLQPTIYYQGAGLWVGPICELEGLYTITGYDNASENIVQYNGLDHIVLQNVYRNGVDDFWAIALD